MRTLSDSSEGMEGWRQHGWKRHPSTHACDRVTEVSMAGPTSRRGPRLVTSRRGCGPVVVQSLDQGGAVCVKSVVKTSSCRSVESGT